MFLVQILCVYTCTCYDFLSLLNNIRKGQTRISHFLPRMRLSSSFAVIIPEWKIKATFMYMLMMARSRWINNSSLPLLIYFLATCLLPVRFGSPGLTRGNDYYAPVPQAAVVIIKKSSGEREKERKKSMFVRMCALYTIHTHTKKNGCCVSTWGLDGNNRKCAAAVGPFLFIFFNKQMNEGEKNSFVTWGFILEYILKYPIVSNLFCLT